MPTSACEADSQKWRYWVIFGLAVFMAVTSGVSFFTSQYTIKKDEVPGDTALNNVRRSSLASFIVSVIIIALVVMVLFFKKQIVSAAGSL